MVKLKRLIWFLKQPQLYPEALRRINRKLRSLLLNSQTTYTSEARAKAQKEATDWCEKYAIDTQTAIFKLTGLAKFESFENQFADTIILAENIVKECPQKMGGGGNLDLIYQLSEYFSAKQVIETGVSYGWSSLAFLLSLKNRQGSLLVSTDLPYLFENSQKYVGCVVLPELKSFWKILPYADREALPKALSLLAAIDIAHYDSDKFYEGKLWAYPQLWQALRPGGIFISDDVNDDFAFRDFCNSIQQEPLIVKTPIQSGAKYVGVLTKPKN